MLTVGASKWLHALMTIVLLLVTACSAKADAAVPLVKIRASSAAFPWLESAYDCAPPSVAIVLTDDSEADILLRLTEPEALTEPAYQIGTDDLLVVTHPQVGVGALSSLEVEALFAGQFANWRDVGGVDQAVLVWAFAPTVDIQAYFDRVVLHGRPISSLARLAVSAQHMSDSVGTIPGSIGLIPRRWKAGNTREAFELPSLPVLAVLRAPPQGAISDLVACMQSRK